MLYYTSFQGSTMLTGPGVLQWKKFILEPSVFIPFYTQGGGHSRTFQLEGMYTVVLQRVCASFVVYGSTGTILCKLCSIR